VIFMKYYAVKHQDGKDIFTSWDACKEYLVGKKGIEHKSFKTLEEAKAFLNDEEVVLDYKIPTAYIDGSYDVTTGCYSFGGILIVGNTHQTFSKKYEVDEYSLARNVAGEIKGAGYIIKYAINHGIKELNIVYDYEGIEKWYTGVWKASSPIALAYINFKNEVKDKIKIHFIKVKSHSNDKYNDMADKLAKSALGI
ncbi:MAG: ribonuclease H family protein, partial [Anaeroplasmataceae bacterium]|nr:ribonuclease H family protein [Anaeroplasmataceae bacterium]